MQTVRICVSFRADRDELGPIRTLQVCPPGQQRLHIFLRFSGRAVCRRGRDARIAVFVVPVPCRGRVRRLEWEFQRGGGWQRPASLFRAWGQVMPWVVTRTKWDVIPLGTHVPSKTLR